MEECNSIVLKNSVDIIKKIIDIIYIIGPILCIISITILLVKLVTNPDNKDLTKKIKNSIIALILVFFIPFTINLVFSLMGSNTKLSACWNSNNSSNNGGNSSYTSSERKRKKIINGNSSYERAIETQTPTPSGSSNTSESTTSPNQDSNSKNAKLIKKEETNTLKVSIYKVDSHYETKIWVKDAYSQMNKMDSPNYGTKLYRPGALLNKAIKENNLSNKLVIGFNASGFYLKDTYDSASVDKYPKYDKTSVGTLVITNGKVVRNAYNYAVKTWYITGIDKNNTMRIFEDKKSNNANEKKAWADSVIGTIRNTYTFASPLVINSQASDITTSMPSVKTANNRQAICQIDKNNFLLITGSNLARKDLINIMLREKCQTGTNFDGGGSIALILKSKNSSNIETIIGNKRSLSEVGYFNE